MRQSHGRNAGQKILSSRVMLGKDRDRRIDEDEKEEEEREVVAYISHSCPYVTWP